MMILPRICSKGGSRRQEARAHRWGADSQYRGMVSCKTFYSFAKVDEKRKVAKNAG